MTILLFAQMLAGHTGSLTNAAILFADGDLDAMFCLLWISFSFLVGLLLVVFFPTDRFQPRLHYGSFLIVMGLILLLFNFMGYNNWYFLTYVALTLGIQNGMFVFYHGLVIRTTALTGTITDIGVEVGRMIRGVSKDEWKVAFHTPNVTA